MPESRTQRPRKMAVNAHATYSGHTFVIQDPTISGTDEAKWKELEKACGISFNLESRTKIIAASHAYVMHHLLHENGANLAARKGKDGREKQAKPIQDFHRQLNKLLKTWRTINQNDFTATTLNNACIFGSNNNFNITPSEIQTNLELLHIAMCNYFQKVDASIRTVTSAQTSTASMPPPYDKYIREMAQIFEDAGGTVSMTYPTATSQKHPPFFYLMKSLNNLLPDFAQHFIASDSAFAQTICRALK